MKHQLIFTSKLWAFGLVIGLGSSSLVHAQIKSRTYDGDKASIVANTKKSSDELVSSLYKNFPAIASQVPMVQSVVLLNKKELGKKPSALPGITSQKKTITTYYLTSQNKEIFPDSLFQVVEVKNECDKIVTTPCPENYGIEINGPIHFYRDHDDASTIGSQSTNGISALNASALSDSFKFNLKLKDQDALPTEVTFEMEIKSRSYMSYFRALNQKSKIRTVPVEDEIKTAFLVWGGEFVNALEK